MKIKKDEDKNFLYWFHYWTKFKKNTAPLKKIEKKLTKQRNRNDIFLEEPFLWDDMGSMSFQATERTFFVTLIDENIFDSNGCPPPRLLSK